MFLHSTGLQLFFLLLVFSSLSFSADLPPSIPSGDYILLFYARDFSTSQPLSNKIIQFWLESFDKKITSSETSGEDGSVVLFVDEGEWKVKSEIEDSSTEGRDYVALADIQVYRDVNYTLNFQQVGTIYAEVTDAGNQLVQHANATINCVDSAYNVRELNEELRVENSVLFVKYFPIGACKIIVSTSGSSTFADVNLTRGELRNISIKFEKQENLFQYLFIALIALLGVLLFFFIKQKANVQLARKTQALQKRPLQKTREKRKPVLTSPPAILETTMQKTKRMMDVMNALNEREQLIVETLLKHDGKLKQSKLYRETLIPKTSLSRAIQSLQTRNIIELIPFGKTNFVKLSNWFLKGEEE